MHPTGSSDAAMADAAALDARLAAGDAFCERLCLARRPPDGGPASSLPAPAGDEVAACRLWPALRYDSFAAFLTDGVAAAAAAAGAADGDDGGDGGGAFRDVVTLKARLTVAFHRAARTSPSRGRPHGVAYLLGTGGRLAAVPRADGSATLAVDDDRLFDFYARLDQMDEAAAAAAAAAGNGHVASAAFRAAFRLAMARMEAEVDGTGEALAGGREREGEAALPLLTDAAGAMSSARKTCSDVELSPLKRQRQQARDSPLKREATYSDVEPSPLKKKRQRAREAAARRGRAPSSGDEDAAAGAHVPVRSVQFADGTAAEVGSLSLSPSHCASPDRRRAGHAPREGEGGSSPDGSDADAESQASCFRSPSPPGAAAAAARAAARARLPWPRMWEYLRKEEGWTHHVGTGLVDYYYVHPRAAAWTKARLLREGTEGADYFATEGDVRDYARARMGWRGDAEEEAPAQGEEARGDGAAARSPEEAELADRVKKRTRAAARAAVAEMRRVPPRKAPPQEKKKQPKRASSQEEGNDTAPRGPAGKQAPAAPRRGTAQLAVLGMRKKTAPKKKAPPPQPAAPRSEEDDGSKDGTTAAASRAASRESRESRFSQSDDASSAAPCDDGGSEAGDDASSSGGSAAASSSAPDTESLSEQSSLEDGTVDGTYRVRRRGRPSPSMSTDGRPSVDRALSLSSSWGVALVCGVRGSLVLTPPHLSRALRS